MPWRWSPFWTAFALIAAAVYSIYIYSIYNVPSRTCPLFTEASAAQGRNGYDGAIRAYSEFLAKLKISKRDTICALRERAYAREHVRDVAGAEADWSEAIRIAPTNPRLYSSRGFFYVRQNRQRLAIEDFEHGKQLKPKDSAFRYGLGRAYASEGKFKKAVEYYSEALRLYPSMFKALQWRAKAYRRLHRYKEAARDQALGDKMEKRFLKSLPRRP